MAVTPKPATVALQNSLLMNGTPLDITVLPKDNSNSYVFTVTYEMEGTTYTLQTQGLTKTFTVPYNTLVSQLGGDNSAEITVTVETFITGGLYPITIGTNTASALIKTGAMPLSLWDDMNGGVGATFGLEASGPGVNFMIDAVFGSSLIHPDIDFSNATVSEWFRYQAGETYEVGNDGFFPGLITSSGNNLVFSIPLPRSAEGRTVTVTALTLNARAGGQYVGGSDYNFLTNSTVTAEVDSYDGRYVKITCAKSGGWGIANNTMALIIPSLPIGLSFS